MELMTSWERKGIEIGKQEGRQEGKQEGRQEGILEGKQEGKEELLALQVQRLFGPVSPEVSERINRLSSDQLNELGKALLDFKTSAELVMWLSDHGSA